jgi:hypothetical protein
VAAGLGEGSDALRGLAVLGVNLVALQVTGTATLMVQRLRTPARVPPPGSGDGAAPDRFE